MAKTVDELQRSLPSALNRFGVTPEQWFWELEK
jgi:hypothetical protein